MIPTFSEKKDAAKEWIKSSPRRSRLVAWAR
jgi:hypothetical protein